MTEGTGPDTLRELSEWINNVLDWNDRTDRELPGIIAHAERWEQERSDAAALRDELRSRTAALDAIAGGNTTEYFMVALQETNQMLMEERERIRLLEQAGDNVARWAVEYAKAGPSHLAFVDARAWNALMLPDSPAAASGSDEASPEGRKC